MFAYYGVAVREHELSMDMAATAEHRTPEAIVSVARARGLDAELRDGLTVNDLRAEVDAIRPVIVEVQT